MEWIFGVVVISGVIVPCDSRCVAFVQLLIALHRAAYTFLIQYSAHIVGASAAR